jgi:hypothetical protein
MSLDIGKDGHKYEWMGPTGSGAGQERSFGHDQPRLTPEEIFEMICAPEATDDLEDIEFDDDIDEAVERGLIEGWIEEEAFREHNMSVAHGTKLA